MRPRIPYPSNPHARKHSGPSLTGDALLQKMLRSALMVCKKEGFNILDMEVYSVINLAVAQAWKQWRPYLSTAGQNIVSFTVALALQNCRGLSRKNRVYRKHFVTVSGLPRDEDGNPTRMEELAEDQRKEKPQLLDKDDHDILLFVASQPSLSHAAKALDLTGGQLQDLLYEIEARLRKNLREAS